MSFHELEKLLEIELDRIGMPLGPKVSKQQIIDIAEHDCEAVQQPQTPEEWLDFVSNGFFKDKSNFPSYFQELVSDSKTLGIQLPDTIRNSGVRNGFGTIYETFDDDKKRASITIYFNLKYLAEDINLSPRIYEYYSESWGDALFQIDVYADGKKSIEIIDDLELEFDEEGDEIEPEYLICQRDDERERYTNFIDEIQTGIDHDTLTLQEIPSRISKFLEERVSYNPLE